MFFLTINIEKQETISSDTVSVHQTPVIPKSLDIINAIGTITTKPLIIDIIKAGFGLSVELKNIDVITFIPTKIKAVK